jgi:hypothetical protein
MPGALAPEEQRQQDERDGGAMREEGQFEYRTGGAPERRTDHVLARMPAADPRQLCSEAAIAVLW